jgi:hypothetical protein
VNSRPVPLDSIVLIRGALEVGITLFDAANIYGQGDSESAIGRALRDHGDEAVTGSNDSASLPILDAYLACPAKAPRLTILTHAPVTQMRTGMHAACVCNRNGEVLGLIGLFIARAAAFVTLSIRQSHPHADCAGVAPRRLVVTNIPSPRSRTSICVLTLQPS